MMSSHRRSRVPLCLALALVACEGTSPAPTTRPDGPYPSAAVVGQLLPPGTALVCDLRDAQAYARDYFETAERRTVASLLRDMERALDDGRVALARELGFDVLAVTADVADAFSAADGPGAGSDLANAVLACMDVGHGTAVDFTGSLAAFGAFAVRGGTADPPYAPVLARLSSPQWGAEPLAPQSWADALDRRRLLHAHPLDAPDFTSETPVSTAYEWGAVPTPEAAPFEGELVVGACLDASDPRLRVQRASTILPFAALGFCDAAASGSSARRAGPGRGTADALAGLAGLLAGTLAPSPLQASSLVGGVGGRLPSFSPVVVVNAGAVNLTFTVQPVDAIVDEVIPVEVTARGNGGTPLPEVGVTLAIVGNNASFARIIYYVDGQPLDPADGPLVVTTGTDGVAAFRVSLNKPGGFQLSATGDLSGFETRTTTSNLFHIKQ